MAEVYGRVQRIVSKPAGRGTAYNLQMDSGDWYGYGFERPNFGEGDEVSFDVDWNGQYGNVRKGSLQVVGGGGGQQQSRQGGGSYQNNRGGSPRNSGGRPSGGGSYQNNKKSGGREAYWDEKAKRDVVVQRQIQHQASRNAAISVVSAALATNALSLPTKKGDQLDAILAVVDEITERYDFAVDAVGIAAAGGNANPSEPNNVQDDLNYQE